MNFNFRIQSRNISSPLSLVTAHYLSFSNCINSVSFKYGVDLTQIIGIIIIISFLLQKFKIQYIREIPRKLSRNIKRVISTLFEHWFYTGLEFSRTLFRTTVYLQSEWPYSSFLFVFGAWCVFLRFRFLLLARSKIHNDDPCFFFIVCLWHVVLADFIFKALPQLRNHFQHLALLSLLYSPLVCSALHCSAPCPLFFSPETSPHMIKVWDR